MEYVGTLGEAMRGAGGHDKARGLADRRLQDLIGREEFRVWRNEMCRQRRESWRPHRDDPKRMWMHLDKAGGREYSAVADVTLQSSPSSPE